MTRDPSTSLRRWRLPAIALLVVLVAAITAAAVTVHIGEAVVITRFGEPVRVITDPGLAWILPPPVDRVQRIDCRLRTTATGSHGVLTQDGLSLVVQAYAAWRIEASGDAVLRHVRATAQDAAAAAEQVRALLDSSLETVSGRFQLSELVNTEASRMRLAEYEQAVLALVAPEAAATLGIQVVQIGVERLLLPEATLTATVARMAEERRVAAEEHQAAGRQAAADLRAQAERQARIVKAEAAQETARIEADAKAEAAQVYARAHAADPALYVWLRSLSALEHALAGNARLVLSTEAAAQWTCRALGAFLVLAVVLWLCSGVTTVELGDRVVVLRWGAVQRVVESGLVLAWPKPIETLVWIPGPTRTQTRAYRRLAEMIPHRGTSRTTGCLTGDAGLVQVSGSVVFTVADPGAYVRILRDGGSQRLEWALERSFLASAIAVCARRSVDGVLVVAGDQAGSEAAAARERLKSELAIQLDRRLAPLELGIRIQRVDLTAQLPPDARSAFAEVLSAAQAAERQVAEARAEAERIRQQAEAQRVRILSRAEAAARELTSRARVATEDIAALAKEADPDRQHLLRQRLWRERLETILAQASQVVVWDRHRPCQLWVDGIRP